MYPVSLEESGLLQVSLAQGVLEGLVVLVHQGSRGSSIFRGPPPSGGPPSPLGGPPPSGGPPPGYPPLLEGLPSLLGYPLLGDPLYRYPLCSGGLLF